MQGSVFLSFPLAANHYARRCVARHGASNPAYGDVLVTSFEMEIVRLWVCRHSDECHGSMYKIKLLPVYSLIDPGRMKG